MKNLLSIGIIITVMTIFLVTSAYAGFGSLMKNVEKGINSIPKQEQTQQSQQKQPVPAKTAKKQSVTPEESGFNLPDNLVVNGLGLTWNDDAITVTEKLSKKFSEPGISAGSIYPDYAGMGYDKYFQKRAGVLADCRGCRDDYRYKTILKKYCGYSSTKIAHSMKIHRYNQFDVYAFKAKDNPLIDGVNVYYSVKTGKMTHYTVVIFLKQENHNTVYKKYEKQFGVMSKRFSGNGSSDVTIDKWTNSHNGVYIHLDTYVGIELTFINFDNLSELSGLFRDWIKKEEKSYKQNGENLL